MTNNSVVVSEHDAIVQVLRELGVSSEESSALVNELEIQTTKVVMLELLSRLSENEYPQLREQLAGQDTDAQAQVMSAFLEKRFTPPERREAAQAAMQKIVPELRKQLSTKMAGIELDQADRDKLQEAIDKLSAWLSAVNT